MQKYDSRFLVRLIVAFVMLYCGIAGNGIATAAPASQDATQFVAQAKALAPHYASLSDTDKLKLIMPTPTGDSFFDRGPAELGPHGSLRGFRDIDAAAGQAIGRPGRVRAVQYRFVTIDSKGLATYAVATYVYNQSQLDNPPTDILVRSDAVDSLGTKCATGYKLARGQTVSTGWSLDQGYGELMVDHEGPTAAYGADVLGGRAVLDAMLALQRLPRDLIAPPASIRYALQGYSGGAQVTFAANKLMKDYAPSLVWQTVGAAMGGTPVDLEAAYRAMTGFGNLGRGLRDAVSIGLAREYPEMIRYFTPFGLAMAHLLRDQCVDVFMYGGTLFSLVPDQALMVPGTLAAPDVQAVFRQTRFDGLLLSVKSLFYHGDADQWLPYSSVAHEVAWQRAHGADVTLLTEPGGTHQTAGANLQLQVQGWVQTQFALAG